MDEGLRQQAIEKDLKGLLVLHGSKPPRTHDLAWKLVRAVRREAEDS